MESRRQLDEEHSAEAIQRRLSETKETSYLRDAVLGAMDGAITTFAIVAGAIGGGFSGVVVVVLGVAKLTADAVSMAVGNYLGTYSESQRIERVRAHERFHIQAQPEGEREEVRQIFRRKGFDGQVLENIVRVLSADQQQWIDTMIREEYGLPTTTANPLRAALATFFAFIGVGALPLLPFLVTVADPSQAFIQSAVFTAFAFVGVGLFRGFALKRSLWRSALETLMAGSAAAMIAYAVGHWLQQVYGA
jgi:vacuolar iron transporter family protein